MSDNPEAPTIDLDNFEVVFGEILNRVAGATGVADEADLTLPDNPVSVGTRVMSAEEWADKMITRAVDNSAEWKKNVLRPRKHPVEAAIAANGKRKQRLKEAEDEERWLASMKRVDVDAMYDTIEQVGQSAYEAGISARKAKITGKVARLQPMVATLAETLDKMPQDTDADREKKMIAAKRGMQEIGRKLRGIG